MAGIFIGSYSLRVREQGTKDFLPLAFKGSGSNTSKESVFKSVVKTLTHLTTCQRHPSEPHVIRVSNLQQDGTDVWGLVERGEYGFTAHGVDSSTFKPTFSRTAADAELIPLFFRFHLPPTGNTGILMLQRLGVHGAFGDLHTAIVEQFRADHPDYVLSFARFVPASIIKDLSEGKVIEMSLVTHKLPADITDRLKLKGAEMNTAKVEIRLRAKGENSLFSKRPTWIKDISSGKVKIAEVFGNEARVRLKVEYKGRGRTYDFSRIDAAPYVDVSEEIKKDKNGHPNFESINDYCVGLRDELLEQLGKDTPDDE